MLGDERPRETRYWGWELEPIEAKLTRVTEFYDGSRLSDGLRAFIRDGEFWRMGMANSLENLERMVKTPTTSDNSLTDGPTKPRNYYQEVQESN
jgi:hypothetical protein